MFINKLETVPGDSVRVLTRETAFQGYFRVDRYVIQHRLFAGG